MDELTMLREQMASMKQSLNRSQIINKELMNKVMRHRASWLGNIALMELIMTPILTLLFFIACHFTGTSQWFTISFFIMCSIDSICDWKTLRIPSGWFSEMDILSLKKRLSRQKLLRKRQYIVSVPMAAAWCLGFGYEYITNGIGKDMTLDFTDKAIILGIVAFLVAVGLWVSLVIYQRAQRTNDDLLRQIDEYEKES